MILQTFKIRKKEELYSGNPRQEHHLLRIALLTDLHNHAFETVLARTKELRPDLIAIAGDITYGYREYDRALSFLNECAVIAPSFFSYGNHDDAESEDFTTGISRSGVVLLDNGFRDVTIAGVPIRIGGLSSPSARFTGRPKRGRGLQRFWYHRVQRTLYPDVTWLDSFCDTRQPTLLLCHHPEYYPDLLAHREIDLILSGHAHGGQWRIPGTGQGIYAPGQGIFPSLTGGVTDERLVISRGLSNTSWIPRFFNPCEMVLIEWNVLSKMDIGESGE